MPFENTNRTFSAYERPDIGAEPGESAVFFYRDAAQEILELMIGHDRLCAGIEASMHLAGKKLRRRMRNARCRLYDRLGTSLLQRPYINPKIGKYSCKPPCAETEKYIGRKSRRKTSG